jgi:hypothetical protein
MVASNQENHLMFEKKNLRGTKVNHVCVVDGILERGFCGNKANYICTMDGMSNGGFVVKAISLKPKPSHLPFTASINGRNVLCLHGKRDTAFFYEPKAAKVLGFTDV